MNAINDFSIILSFNERITKVEQTKKRSMNIKIFSHFFLAEVLENLGCFSTIQIERTKQRIAINNTYKN